jgi:hypothetical protein
MKAKNTADEVPENDIDRSVANTPQAERENPPPWEMIEAGRYRPRRIRGSYRGRELG